MEQTRRVI